MRLQTPLQPPWLPQRPAVTREEVPAQAEQSRPAHNIFLQNKGLNERKTVGKPTLMGHYSSQNMSKTCHPSVTKPFTNYTVLLIFRGNSLLRQGAAYLATVLVAPGSKLWCSEGCCTAMGNAQSTARPHSAARSATAISSHEQTRWLDFLFKAISHPTSPVKLMNGWERKPFLFFPCAGAVFTQLCTTPRWSNSGSLHISYLR